MKSASYDINGGEILGHRLLECQGLSQVNNYWELDVIYKETAKAWSVLKRPQIIAQEMQQRHSWII